MSIAELTFSVIVNTTDRAASLHTLLRTLEQQCYPHFELVAVVGPTHDNTLDILESYCERVRVVRCPVANLSVSRNIGLRAAAGEIVAFIDDDAVPSFNWLLQLNRIFQDPAIDATGGAVYLVHPEYAAVQHRLGVVSALAEQYDVRCGLLDQLLAEGSGRLWTQRMMGTNMAYRRSSLLRIGGFDEFYEWVYDDTDLAIRLASAGGTVQPVAEACIYHVPASSRNRVVFTFVGRWWIQTKASIYFALKNGRAAGVPYRDIVLRTLHLVHGHWLQYGQLNRNGVITFRQMTAMRWKEITSSAIGVLTGVFQPRRLLAGSEADPQESATSGPFLPFQNSASRQTAAVDPVSGRHAQIAMAEPPLRVALLSHNYPPAQQEGVGRHTNLMAKGLFALGHTVHVLAHGPKESVSFYDGAYVHRVPYRLERYANLRHLPGLHHRLNYSHAVHDRLRRLVLNDGVQVVDSPVWQTDGFVTAVSGMLPVVVRPQTAVRQIARIERKTDEDTRLVGDMEEMLLRRAAYLAPNSQATATMLAQVYGIHMNAGSGSVVPHGIEPVDDDQVRPFPLGRAPVGRTVLYVGRLEKRKGILDLFAAIPDILDKAPETRFVIVGADNSASDGFQARMHVDYRAFFRNRYAGYDEAVTFLGHVPDEELQTLYQRCDLFVAPSLYESFGLIYLEAMNFAKPVIGCNAGGIPEVIEDGVTGMLAEPAAPRQLAEHIQTLITSPRLLHDMGQAGRQRLLDRFTHIQMARGFERAYRQVLSAQAEPYSHPLQTSPQ